MLLIRLVDFPIAKCMFLKYLNFKGVNKKNVSSCVNFLWNWLFLVRHIQLRPSHEFGLEWQLKLMHVFMDNCMLCLCVYLCMYEWMYYVHMYACMCVYLFILTWLLTFINIQVTNVWNYNLDHYHLLISNFAPIEFQSIICWFSLKLWIP